MNNNPFTSGIFTSIWLKHFNENKPGKVFSLFENLLFVKSKFLPLYINVGKTHTKGMSYSISGSNIQDSDGKILLVYDVPGFFELPETNHNRVKLHKVKQYPGFLINLNQYGDFNDYMARTFKKSSRYKLKKYKRKLETCFDIKYTMFYGEMSKSDYDFIFKVFKELLIKRFEDKQITNNILEKQEWDFYREVAYPMILQKKAGLFVINDGTQPIGVTLTYFSNEILFDAITVFDIDYSKFHLGSINIMKLIEWCLEHKIKVFDFSKGYFDYKKRWANKQYDFEYHIFYDSYSFTAKAIAFFLKSYFSLKQTLRDKKVNEKLHQFTFWARNFFHNKKSSIKYEFSTLKQEFTNEEFNEIDYRASENHFLKTMIFDFLYLNNESYTNLRVYKRAGTGNTTFLLCGKTSSTLVKMS